MPQFKTMCPMNCHPTLCGMVVHEENGILQSIDGDPDNPDSQGFLCMRGNAAHEIVANPARLRTPMIRDKRGSDTWRKASWDEALDLVANTIRKVGRQAVGMWQGHGNAINDYGTGVKRGQMERFANLYGCQHWNPAMICWGLGGFGLGLTGALETSTKEDMGQHSNLVVFWGANSVSQANTFKHVLSLKERGAKIVVIDVRKTEATAFADETLVLRPGSDTALALAVMHVMIKEGLYDQDFVSAHTIGFDDLKDHVIQFTPHWAAAQTGLSVETIEAFARQYALTDPAMIVLGGSSVHKGENTWTAARAISCLPALSGNFAKPGGGLGPRHGARSHGAGFVDITATDKRLAGRYVPNQMEAITQSLETGDVKVLISIGSNFLSSFADTNRLRKALKNTELVVAYDIFTNQSVREVADVILPGTIWLEELGIKATNSHVYLCDQILPRDGDVRPAFELYQALGQRLGVEDVYPWENQEAAIDAVLDHPATGHATVNSMRQNGGRAALNISHVAYPDCKFHTASGKIEFKSARAAELGLPELPPPSVPIASDFPLRLAHGRTFAHFHSFYDHGRAIPALSKREPEPELWISLRDAKSRGLEDGDAIRLHNSIGDFSAKAKLTARIPQGTLWIHDGWPGLNALMRGDAVLPSSALDEFPFSVGQALYLADVEIERQQS